MSALQFINREILPSGRWLDGAVRGLPLDAAGVGARSASAMVAAARAGVDVYDLTGRREYLAMAEHILDSLALLQAAWDCPWSGEPFGSIRSSNAGPERSAALQAEAAGVFIDCGLFTNEKRYTERGIAALRAAFASIQAPLEGDSLLSAAGAVAAAELLRARHGDAVVDAEDRVGWGISGCIVSDVRADERTVSFTFVSPWPRPAVVQFRRCSGPREVVVNGVSLGEYDEAELAAGVTCVPRLPLTVSAAPVERCLAGLDLELAAEVTGGACPPDVVLTSRRAGSSVMHKTAMLPCGDVYTARVPSELLADPGMVEYTITATAGDERAAAPGTGRSPGEGVIEVLPELALACGLDDSAYVERECEALEECTSSRVGRMATPASPVFYRLPLPPGTRAADLAVWTDGCCDVLAGGRMLEPAGQCPGPACTWTADDPALWQDGWLRICIRPSDGSSTLVRRIVLTPR